MLRTFQIKNKSISIAVVAKEFYILYARDCPCILEDIMTEQKKFSDIIHDTTILHALHDLGFTTPTEIQEQTIPPALEGKDLIGQAKTGSGKTFAFGIPLFHKLTSMHHAQALILAPTRELCQQIATEIGKLAKHKKAKIAAIYGGVSINPQISDIRSAQIVVGTPGRILDHLERGTLHTEHVHFFVLDEADRMFDMGFIEDVERIASTLPKDRQTLLFSATMPEAVKILTKKYQNNPEHIKTKTHVEEELLPQYYYVVEHNKKFSLLMHLIEQESSERSIIFCATRDIADIVARNLQRHRIDAAAIHGGLSQAKRDHIMSEFKKGKTRILVATDVAARGLDIKDVTHVFNYNVPKNPEDYIHRIGRTARAGKTGKAITLLEDRDFEFFSMILELPNVNPVELKAENVKEIGFRKHEGTGYGGGRSSERGGYSRQGDSRGERRPFSKFRRDGERRESREDNRSSQRSEHKSESRGGWKQSRRQR